SCSRSDSRPARSRPAARRGPILWKRYGANDEEEIVTTLSQDVRYAIRMLARSKGFTAIAVATLALGIGANAAIFSVVNAVLLKPLPFPHPEELVRVTGDLKGQSVTDVGLSAPELWDYRDRSGLFNEISGLFPINANITGGDRPERAEVLLVDTN